MSEDPIVGRRSLLLAGVSSVSALTGPASAARRWAVLPAPLTQSVDTLDALARLPNPVAGSCVWLTDARRGGAFVARNRAAWSDQIASDPLLAIFVPSIIDAAIVWMRDYVGPVSLDWCGAKGDGVTDDAPALNSLLANRFLSWFEVQADRNHFVRSPLEIRRALKLCGAGNRTSVFSTDASIDIINCTLIDDTQHGLQISDIGVVNHVGQGTATGGDGIRLKFATLATLSNIRIKNCHIGLHSTQSNLTNVTGLYIDGFVKAGILFDGGNNFDTRISGFTISGHRLGEHAIELRDMCDEIIFADGVCSTSKVALYTDARANFVNQRPEFCRFSRVSFDSCDLGLDLASCVDFVFDSSFISCRPGPGAHIGVRGRVEQIQFTATTFFNNAQYAALIGASAFDTAFTGCKFISNSTQGAGRYDTLAFGQGCGSFLISGCFFRQGWDVASRPRFQISVATGNAPFSIIGNFFTPGVSGSLSNERHGPSSMIQGNVGL